MTFCHPTGLCVCIYQGEYDWVAVFSGNPVAAFARCRTGSRPYPAVVTT